ncbi:MAG: Gfo/Idh/MocA family oxidoreductase [Anaerolineae bacterium]
MSQPLEAVMIGAGSRGHFAYGSYALQHPDEIRFTAVVEPHDERRRRFAQAHAIPQERQFHTWEDLYAQGKTAQALVNCTLDRMHLDSTLPALEMGYDVLLEKPMVNTLEGNVRLVQVAEQHNRLLMICHVLRYTTFFSTLHEIITSGRLGDVITVEHRENVAYWHMAHSFVRGNWRNSELESPMILAKCCHDLDILFWNLGPVTRLDSFGSLAHYRAENAPEGAPARCADGCPVAGDCTWYAPRLYLHDYVGWPVSVISEDTSLEARQRALETGPYGRCVYHCDNDVVDHQTVNMEFESGATGALFMHGHSHEEGRTMRYDGTRATLRGRFAGLNDSIEIHDHLTGRVEKINLARGIAGHGGGDEELMTAFVKALRDPGTAMTTARESLESHLMAFAAGAGPRGWHHRFYGGISPSGRDNDRGVIQRSWVSFVTRCAPNPKQCA